MFPIFITFLTFKDHGRIWIRRNNSAPAKILLLPFTVHS